MPRSKLIYLAAPYTHEDPQVRETRFQLINGAASHLMRAGVHLFSPISHTHPIALAGGLPTGWDFWRSYDETMLSACGAIVVLMLAGWDTSKGVTAEVSIGEKIGLPIWWTRNNPNALDDVAREFKSALVPELKAKAL